MKKIQTQCVRFVFAYAFLFHETLWLFFFFKIFFAFDSVENSRHILHITKCNPTQNFVFLAVHINPFSKQFSVFKLLQLPHLLSMFIFIFLSSFLSFYLNSLLLLLLFCLYSCIFHTQTSRFVQVSCRSVCIELNAITSLTLSNQRSPLNGLTL